MRIYNKFNNGLNFHIIYFMIGNTHQQLINLFNSIFCKESLRRNTYIFNSLNQRMEISIKTIARERRVTQITNDSQTIILALKECPFIEVITPYSVKILMKGDQVIVKLRSSQGKKINKKEIHELAKHMKFQTKQTNETFQIQFQSQAATTQFIQRLKINNSKYQFEILEKDPYKCLQESISNMRKEKKNIQQTYEPQPHYYNNNFINYDTNHYYQQLPVFIRKSVPSSDQETDNKKFQIPKKYVEKAKLDAQIRPRFSSQDFPTFQKLSLQQSNKPV